MVPYSAHDQAPGFDAYLLTVANEMLGASDPSVQELGEGILHRMRCVTPTTASFANTGSARSVRRGR